MSDRFTILCGDAPEQLTQLADGSIDLAVTSPPYDKLRESAYNSAFDFEALAVQLYRVLRDGGVLCWNVGDSVVNGSETLTSCKQKICFRNCGFLIHDTMIYHKDNFSNPSHNRYHQVFEYVFILSKGRPRVFNPIKDKPNLWAGSGTFGKNTIREADGSIGLRTRNIITEMGMRGNVWKGKTRGQEEMCLALPHPAMMPKWLARDLILSWSNPNDLCLDPFCGSGTTLRMALETGRRAIGIDLSQEYCRLAEQECNSVTPGFAFA